MHDILNFTHNHKHENHQAQYNTLISYRIYLHGKLSYKYIYTSSERQYYYKHFIPLKLIYYIILHIDKKQIDTICDHLFSWKLYNETNPFIVIRTFMKIPHSKW